jgi:hypothetical protein
MFLHGQSKSRQRFLAGLRRLSIFMAISMTLFVVLGLTVSKRYHGHAELSLSTSISDTQFSATFADVSLFQ